MEKIIKKQYEYIVLEEDNNLIGFLSFCPSRDEDVNPENVAEISAIYLNPNKWRKGFGKILCDAAVKELKKSGYIEITLWVVDKNHQAKKFYEKIRFINSCKIKKDERDDYTLREIKYRKIL